MSIERKPMLPPDSSQWDADPSGVLSDPGSDAKKRAGYASVVARRITFHVSTIAACPIGTDRYSHAASSYIHIDSLISLPLLEAA